MSLIRNARAFALFLIVALSVPALQAQVPQLINYQGRIAVGSPAVNFDGSGRFKFAIVNTDGTTTYWSNDGTSTAGSQPTAAVALTVTKGLYSVLLGDTTLANMTAIPATVFDNADVRLRVWFDDNGTHGWQRLTPDQRIAAVGYAMMANTVPNGSITSDKLDPNLNSYIRNQSALSAVPQTGGFCVSGDARIIGTLRASVQLDSNPVAATAATAGCLRWNGGSNGFEYSDGTSWKQVAQYGITGTYSATGIISNGASISSSSAFSAPPVVNVWVDSGSGSYTNVTGNASYPVSCGKTAPIAVTVTNNSGSTKSIALVVVGQ